MKSDVTPTVLAIEQMDLSGNMIPPSWYQEIKTDSGKTALLAINILADIVYWYRPTIRRDETSGMIVSKGKKFKADKLQKKYQHYADFLGVPKDAATDAIDLLVKRGLITREFRTIHVNGSAMNNVMFLEPVPEKIAEITFRVIDPMGKKPDRVSPKNGESLPPKKSHTNTEITTKTDLNVNERTALLATLYQDNITMLTSMSADMIKDAAEVYTESSWYEDAFKIAVANNARNWKYIETILKNWKEKGRDWKPDHKQNNFTKGKSNGYQQKNETKPSNNRDGITEADRVLGETIARQRLGLNVS